MLDPTPELPDDTPIDQVGFPIKIYNALVSVGLTTVGQIRETPDAELRLLRLFGKGTLAYLREKLG
jgi:hypothetical protein